MTIKDYQEQAKRTCPDLGSEALNLAHMALGIFSEYNELVDATDTINETEEIADCWWYIANYCTYRGYNLENIVKFCCKTLDVDDEVLFIYAQSKLQDLVKKYIAYNKEINKSAEETYLFNICFVLIEILAEMQEAEVVELTLEDILERNINKLKVRFPHKFTKKLANNRNLAAEKKALK